MGKTYFSHCHVKKDSHMYDGYILHIQGICVSVTLCIMRVNFYIRIREISLDHAIFEMHYNALNLKPHM
jgi:hypothetical protein